MERSMLNLFFWKRKSTADVKKQIGATAEQAKAEMDNVYIPPCRKHFFQQCDELLILAQQFDKLEKKESLKSTLIDLRGYLDLEINKL
jgi:hypothetical protein